KVTLILRQTQRFVDGVICNSKAVGEITAQQEGFSFEKIAVIYNGFKSVEFGNGDLSDNGLLPKTELVIGIVANLRPIKRIDDLIRAFRSEERRVGKECGACMATGT